MVTPNIRTLSQSQLLQAQEQRRISSQDAVAEIMRRRSIDASRQRSEEIRRERIAERTEARQLTERALSTPAGRALAQREFERTRSERAPTLAQERLRAISQRQAPAAASVAARTAPTSAQAALSQPQRAPREPVAVGTVTRTQRTEAIPGGTRTTTTTMTTTTGPDPKQAMALRQLQRFRQDDGFDLTAAVRRVGPSTLTTAGFTQQQIDAAKQRNIVTDKLKPFTDKEGNINLEQAKRGGVDNQSLRDVGFTRQEIKDAQLRIVSLRRLRPFAVQGGGYDIVSAISTKEGAEARINRTVLERAGFTSQQITEAEELGRNLNPEPGTRKWYLSVGKEVGVTAADAIIPGLWARNWNNLSNTERAVNIGLDALFLVPLVGVAARGAKVAKVAGTAARAGRVSSSSKKVLSAVRQSQQATKVANLGDRVEKIDKAFTGIARRNKINDLLQTELRGKQAPRAAQARQSAKDVATRIENIDKAFTGQARRNKIDEILRSDIIRTPNRAQDAAILKVAGEIRDTVLSKTANPKAAGDAEQAVIEVGNALATGNELALKSAFRKLSQAGKQADIKALTNRVKGLESQSVSVDDFFKGVRNAADDLPKAPTGVDDRIRNIDKFFDGAKKLEIEEAKAAREKGLLEQEVRLAESKLQDLERRGVGRPETKRLLQERVRVTKTQLADRPKPSAKLQTLLTTQPGGPIARAVPTSGPIRATRTTTKALARTTGKPKAGARTATRAATRLKPIAVPVPRSRAVTATLERPTVSPKLVALLKTTPATSVKISPKQTTTTKVKVKPLPKMGTKAVSQTTQATKLTTAQKVDTKIATEVKVKPLERTKTRTETRTRTRTRPVTKVTTATLDRVATKSKFKLPNTREEKKLKPGEFPRVVTWQQGLFNVTVDIDKGTRSFKKAATTGKGVDPNESFTVVTKDQSRPVGKQFRQGAVDLVVTPRSLSFIGRRGGHSRPLRGAKPKLT